MAKISQLCYNNYMSAVTVIFYEDKQGCPVLEWLESIQQRSYAKGIIRIERLAELGHTIRRPEADFLRDGIYELRWRLGSVNYRIFYFFHGRELVVLAHGITKEKNILDKDIDLAVKRKETYLKEPEKHTHYEVLK